MVKRTDIPQFGTLSGVRVVFVGSAIAGPFAAEMMAEQGADVIWIENALAAATSRSTVSYAHSQDRRDERFLALNIPTTQGRETFLRLMRTTDILIENFRGGQFAKWSLDDETLWTANPKLVITHVSGFGQDGDPDYIERPSWDGIGQAFGGYMNINGYNHPHYQARHVFMEWDDPELQQRVKGVSPVPRFKNNPSRIWRGCDVFGADNDDILSEVGYSPEEIRDLYENKIISH